MKQINPWSMLADTMTMPITAWEYAALQNSINKRFRDTIRHLKYNNTTRLIF